jgi:D-methionine transport system substrate-binding protein
MTAKLARFYRTALSRGRTLVTIREELDLCRNYLDLQKIRFANIEAALTVEEEALLDMPVIKLIVQPFLENANAKQGFKLVGVGKGILANFGLYSLKHKSFDDIPQDGKVGIANDPVNQGRGLLLLQKAGLLKLKPDVGYLGSLNDIVENPKNLSFVEVEGPQLVRITGDVDLALGYPHFIVASKAFDPSSGLAYSGIEDLKFGVQFVAQEAKKDDPVINKFVEIFHNSAAVKEAAGKGFNNDERLYTLVWTK